MRIFQFDKGCSTDLINKHVWNMTAENGIFVVVVEYKYEFSEKCFSVLKIFDSKRKCARFTRYRRRYTSSFLREQHTFVNSINLSLCISVANMPWIGAQCNSICAPDTAKI